MSSNLAVVNFSVGGTLTVSGETTFGEITSINSASFQGLSTSNLTVSGETTFNGYLPTSNQTPINSSQLITKNYCDDADIALNNLITSTDDAQKVYIDGSFNTLYNRITSTDSDQKSYIDASYGQLNIRITDTDSAQKTYIDDANTILNTKINTYGKKGYISTNTYRTFSANELGFSQFIELRPKNDDTSGFYIIHIPNPTTCSGQIIYIWNNADQDLGISQTGNNLFIRTGENTVSVFLRSKTAEMYVSSGQNWINFESFVLQI